MLHSHTQWDNAFGTSSERVCKRAADCVCLCVPFACWSFQNMMSWDLIIPHRRITLTEGTLIGGFKTNTQQGTQFPPSTKRPQLTAKGNVTGTAQQMGLSVFVPDTSICWSHGRLVAGYAPYVYFIYEVLPKST